MPGWNGTPRKSHSDRITVSGEAVSSSYRTVNPGRAARASSTAVMYRRPRATDSSTAPPSSGRHAGSNEECSEATAAAGCRSRNTSFASGQQAAIRSQTSTLLGVLTTIRGLPLRWSASASTRSHSMCSRSSMVSSSPSSEASIHLVSARTPRCFSGSSGGAYSSVWLPRMARSSVDPDRGAEKMNTGAVSSRPPGNGGSFQVRSARGRDR
jgi:hypothetical protein